MQANRRGPTPGEAAERPSTSECSSPSGEPINASKYVEKSPPMARDSADNQHSARDQNRESTTGLFEYIYNNI